MADITELALRAVISGLHHSGKLAEKDVLAIMGEMQRLAAEERDAHHPVEHAQLMQLASLIGRDARIAD